MAVVGNMAAGRAGRKLPVSNAGPLPWTPYDLAPGTIWAWLDAEDAGTIDTVGGAVTVWRNKAGPGQVVGGSTSFRPLLDPLGINSRPAIVFDGTDDYLSGGATFTDLDARSGSVPRELWGLVRQDAPSSDTLVRNIFRHGSTGNQRLQLARSVVASVNRFRSNIGNGSSEPPAVETTIDFTGVHAIRTSLTSTTISSATDSSPLSTLASVGIMSISSLYIGAQNTSSTFWQGAVNQFIITAPLSVDDATKMMNWLKEKGGTV